MCFLAKSTTDYGFGRFEGNGCARRENKVWEMISEWFQTKGLSIAHLYSPRCSLLEGTSVDTLMEVNGVLARYDILQCTTFSSLVQTISC